jgi:predicted TPR repeat methyltransferase
MSKSYVENLFDQYAGRFDRELVETLGYNAPALLRAALMRVAGEERHYARVLDLGCGTGLMGEAIHDRADEIAGVDLSARMVEAAKQKNIYARLLIGDLVECIETEIEPFDLILAADVFVYLPDLRPVLGAAAKKLKPSGLFAFTTETHPGDEVILRDTFRFAHAEPYLRAAAKEAGFDILLLERASTRREKNIPVEGLLAVLRQNA